ncbi:transketolase [Kallotenue papyrolyticum]|uniref:transketolase n=1 Tax=Kallotenue papyrolyticum TaxID=1325125 RepID=UPI0004785C3C|nr:transketolase [Kallotenue papyrolyticum]
MTQSFSDLDRRAANTIRGLTLDAVQQANSGHPGLPLGMADAAIVLWTRVLKYNPADPRWPDRDRFILSAGHGSMLLYALLHLTGYRHMTLEQLQRFRQYGSLTAGHPEVDLDVGIETTTGPLGQGFATGVGMAIAERHLAARFNRPGFPIVDHYTYAICSDGDLMEGVSHEAASLAGHLKLGRLIYLYDDNHVTIDGPTDLTYSDDVARRFEAYGWHVQRVDGHDMPAVADAIAAAQRESERPSLIICRTIIGYGMPNRQGTAKAHSDPPGEEEVRLAKERLGLPPDRTFYIPDDVRDYLRAAGARGAERQRAWEQLFARYRQAYPELAAEWDTMWRTTPPAGWDAELPRFDPDPKGVATRAASGKVIEAIWQRMPQLVGGSADLTPSNNTRPKGAQELQSTSFAGRYIHFGVREHGMAAALNGMALHGGLLPYGGTFFTFSDYLRPALRLAALMRCHNIFIFTHDSIGLGEDGPTHQPVEHLAACRAMPNLLVIRPSDANETVEAWRVAIEHTAGPVALVLTRQPVPVLDRRELGPAEGLRRGGYVVQDVDDPQVLLIATGSEVALALDAAKLLAERDVRARVVALPCWELFEQQDQAYRDQVLPPHITARVGVEAAARLGWDRWIGPTGAFVGVDNRFGASAPYKEIYRQYGLTPERVAEAALRQLGRPADIASSEPEAQRIPGRQPAGHEGHS